MKQMLHENQSSSFSANAFTVISDFQKTKPGKFIFSSNHTERQNQQNRYLQKSSNKSRIVTEKRNHKTNYMEARENRRRTSRKFSFLIG